jgi:integrase
MTSQTATSDRRKYLTEEELKRFFAVIKNVRDRALFTVAYWRGLRASEIGSIPWSDWNQKKRQIWITRLKGSDSGEYPLSPAEQKALVAWRDVRGNAAGPMFSSRNSSSFTRSEKEQGKKSAGIGRGMVHILFRDTTRQRPGSRNIYGTNTRSSTRSPRTW